MTGLSQAGARVRVSVVTGSRADYGLLYFLMQDLQADPDFELAVAVTGMHLSPEFGLTVRQIEHDGFPIGARIEMLLSSDTSVGVAKATGLGVIGFADALRNMRPDLIVVLGDRYEIFAAAQAALFLRIPIAHIGGGDITVGAFDEAMRHSISKMAHLHFVTNADAAERLTRMGENPRQVFNVGSPGLDHLHRSVLPDRTTIEQELGFKFLKRNFLVTFHPVTLDPGSSVDQLNALLSALDEHLSGTGVIFTLPNADTDGRALIEVIRAYAAERSNCRVYTSLGQRLYLGTLAQVDVVIGNSSSGLYEAPSLSTPTVNIGRRQEGRLRASSVFDCAPEAAEILAAIQKALAFGRTPVVNPYKQGDCAQLIMETIRSTKNLPELVLKSFYDGDAMC